MIPIIVICFFSTIEKELAYLSLEDEGYEILEVQEDPDFVPEAVELRKGKDPLKIPLIFTNFWVQIHGVPPSFFTESLAHQIGSFLGNFLEFNGTNLGHNDSFCQAKMALRYEVAKIGWDLSLRANSRRARDMSNVWLREDGDGDKRGNYYRSQELVRGFDPILGVNLKGDLNLVSLWNGGSSKEKGQLEMDHDLEDSVMVEGDGKKRPRREKDRSKVVDELKTSAYVGVA
ncbi:hypothetical protein Gohar_027014 [Gossypium harknessii]|uniref:DUF4283 domain-containing protein n=1 Tax=Gossypium harknessii TaxID=34285 RepID=A0A7J9HUW8_9ROSI|nr:hypothetical protein [Gossypium harknessii]